MDEQDRAFLDDVLASLLEAESTIARTQHTLDIVREMNSLLLERVHDLTKELGAMKRRLRG